MMEKEGSKSILPSERYTKMYKMGNKLETHGMGK
jgi:hypothetical protein